MIVPTQTPKVNGMAAIHTPAEGNGVYHPDPAARATRTANDIAVRVARQRDAVTALFNDTSPLLPQHVADLARSGITEAQAVAAGIRSIRADSIANAIMAMQILNSSLNRRKVPALAFTFRTAAGTLHENFCRLKPDTPWIDAKGKPQKYESPEKFDEDAQGNFAYFPYPYFQANLETAAPILIVEGEKKALRAAIALPHYLVIGLVGIWGWTKGRECGPNGQKHGPLRLLDELDILQWAGRLVIFANDSDRAQNDDIRNAEIEFARILRDKNPSAVRMLQFSPGPDGSKTGADDYLLRYSAEALEGMIRTTPDYEWPATRRSCSVTTPSVSTPNESSANEEPDDPHRLARLFIAERCTHADGLTLRFWRDEWNRWDGSAYCVLPDGELRAELTASVKAEMDRQNLLDMAMVVGDKPPPTVHKITKGMIGNVELALGSMTVLPGLVDAPGWLTGRTATRRNLIALSNGLLDLDALFADNADVLLPHTPRWLSSICLPYPFDAEAHCPRWLASLDRNLEADRERIALLQEWFGLCLTPDTSHQKFMMFEGEGSNGKSVVDAALEAMLGSENCSHVPLEVFGERFQLTPTLDKLANIASEVGELDKAAEGFLKSFTSGDPMQFDRKFKEPIHALPTARLVLATNNRPRFSDRSGGLWRRMILMPFRVTIGENDPARVRGMDKPKWWEESGELPGMLNWALAGLDRLRHQGHFTLSRVCEEALAEYRTENNPARMFLTEGYEAKDGCVTLCGVLFEAYRDWCNVRGYSPLADRSFGKEIRRVFTKVERRERKKGEPGEGRDYVYAGVKAKEPEAKENKDPE